MNPLPIVRHSELLRSDDKRVITRYFNLGSSERIQALVEKIVSLSPNETDRLLSNVMERFGNRHRDLKSTLLKHCERAISASYKAQKFNTQQKLLLGTYVTLEYSFESAALFNPSVVPHPDQSGLTAKECRFLMSLRATGEGHVSSIVFRRGIIRENGSIEFDPPPRYAFTGTLMFPDIHTEPRLRPLLKRCRPAPENQKDFHDLSEAIIWQLSADYHLSFPKDCKPAEMVIFPGTRFERRGIEDLRMVRFADNNDIRYLGTYTAYDGESTHPMLIESADFHDFHISPMFGLYAKNKGIAIFPRKINGRYCAISRHDKENLFLLRSKDLRVWNQAVTIMKPKYPWEFVQLGNCGSPLETEHGWLLITHAVGPMREYGIGIALLDLNNPSKVISRLPYPILVANEDERSGYVPNVVYSCGSMIHNGRLVIPYAMSDSRTAFASISIVDILKLLLDKQK